MASNRSGSFCAAYGTDTDTDTLFAHNNTGLLFTK